MAHDLAWDDGQAEELGETTRERGWLVRLLGIHDTGRMFPVALVVGGLAAAAFVASLGYDWQRSVVDLTAPADGGDQAGQPPNTLSFSISLGTVDGLGNIYVLSVVGMLAVIGVAVTRPDLALRLRAASTGVGVGLIGVLLALTLRLPSAVLSQQTLGQLPNEYRDRVTTAHEPGLYLAYVTVALCVAAVWLAGPGRRGAAQTLTDVAAAPGPNPPGPPPPAPRASFVRTAAAVAPGAVAPAPIVGPAAEMSAPGPIGGTTGLSVSAAEPIEPGLHPGDQWRR